MTVSPERFKRYIKKLASSALEDNEDATRTDSQSEATPQLPQPDAGPASGFRAAIESLSTGGEKASKSGELDYVKDAFNEFNAAAKQTGHDLHAALAAFGPDSAASSSVAKDGATKLSARRTFAILDELQKMGSMSSKIARNVRAKW